MQNKTCKTYTKEQMIRRVARSLGRDVEVVRQIYNALDTVLIDTICETTPEEDVKIKVIIPFLKELGYTESELRFEHSIDVAIGTKKTKVFSDIEIIIDGRVEIVIDTKTPTKSISEKDVPVVLH